MKISKLSWLVLILIFILIVRLAASILEKQQDIFWFCIINLLLLILGVYYKNDLILSSVAVSALFVEILRTTDMIWFFATGEFLTSVANYLRDASTFTTVLNFYHILLLIIPIYYLLKENKFHNKAWIFSSLTYLASSLATLIFTGSNTNCARFYCDLGIFDFIYILKYPFMPFFIFHWIGATILIFIPSHYIIKYFVRKITN
jgi:hypothetical protein